MITIPEPIAPPHRILMGPGPSDVAPSVLTAMAQPTLGHLDPRFLEIMDQIATCCGRCWARRIR